MIPVEVRDEIEAMAERAHEGRRDVEGCWLAAAQAIERVVDVLDRYDEAHPVTDAEPTRGELIAALRHYAPTCDRCHGVAPRRFLDEGGGYRCDEHKAWDTGLEETPDAPHASALRFVAAHERAARP